MNNAARLDSASVECSGTCLTSCYPITCVHTQPEGWDQGAANNDNDECPLQ